VSVVDTVMGETTPPNDGRNDGDSDADRSNGGGLPVPEPVDDEVTVELVRDAIGVARGDLSDEQFSRKYGTTSER